MKKFIDIGIISFKKWNSCKRKVRHKTHKEAKDCLNRMKKGGICIKPMQTYECIFCKGWHIGHKRKKNKRDT